MACRSPPILGPGRPMLTFVSVDMAVQLPTLPLFAFNNTYGIKAIEESDYRSVMRLYNSETGCGAALASCRRLATAIDPESIRMSTEASNACTHTAVVCSNVPRGYSLWSSVSDPIRSHSDPRNTKVEITEKYCGCDVEAARLVPATSLHRVSQLSSRAASLGSSEKLHRGQL